MSRCRRAKDENGNWFWIPGCVARAVNDGDCTCGPRKGSNSDLGARVDDLERRVAELSQSYLELRYDLKPLQSPTFERNP